ncbi:SDR family NAD(P)-dependent oxidoreductase [Novosphingobium malaysiense]|uniref:SDR family NAD(P)-dependent oxidoreductase n=1 Tax=Novosphingobium malaysiense TaxID=1348853 RepID=UPI000689EFE7|nr:SDR family NAD(P)-dependent oxidoreductase [Novosphingobium malaysiense]
MAAQSKNWLITGASSGLGQALADAVLDKGGTVVATFRKQDQCEAFEGKAPGRSFAVQMDVTDAASVDAAVKSALEKAGRIDVLVNNAGYALRGLVEQVSDEEALKQLDTNVMGIIRVTRAVLPAMRAQGRGRIINISSTSGTVGYPLLGIYSASKHAVMGLSEALAGEVASLGIEVICVEPGGFKSKFASSSMIMAQAAPAEDYAPLLEQMNKASQDVSAWQRGDPEIAAERLIELAEMDNPPARLALGDDALPSIAGALQKRMETYEAHAGLGQGTSFS